MRKEIEKISNEILHPESRKGLLESGIVDDINILKDEAGVVITLVFPRSRDPFAKSLSKQLEVRIQQALPQIKDNIKIEIKQNVKEKEQKEQKKRGEEKIKHIIAIASGKGGVGKSTVTSNLAITLTQMGYSVGILDADIYGPSQPRMFGLEGFVPLLDKQTQMITPAEAHGVKIMSIGFFIDPKEALIWRGPMATSALRQLIHQSDWGELDFLLVDLPPGTGDVHLTLIQELKIDSVVIVTTPQNIAIDDVRRGVSMFLSQSINIPIIGVIENMAWFTPLELPESRYYLFGKGGAKMLAEERGLTFLGEVPILQGIMDGSEDGKPGVLMIEQLASFYKQIAEKVVDNHR